MLPLPFVPALVAVMNPEHHCFSVGWGRSVFVSADVLMCISVCVDVLVGESVSLSAYNQNTIATPLG